MGTCCSTQSHVGARPSARTFSAPLPAPMQDQVNALLNRWRHGEVNLLARKFREARDSAANAAQARSLSRRVASRIMLKAAAKPSPGAEALESDAREDGDDPALAGEVTAAATAPGAPAAAADAEAGAGDVAGAAGAATVPDATDAAAPMLAVPETTAVRATGPASALNDSGRSAKSGGSAGAALGAAATNGAAAAVPSAAAPPPPPPLKRRGLTREGMAAAFPLAVRLPEAAREAAFNVFDSQARGTVEFRDFCRALALCSRGTRLERLRFLFDLFCTAGPKHTGKQLGPYELPEGAEAEMTPVEVAALCKYCGVVSDVTTLGLGAARADGALELSAFFDWAETALPEEVLDRALEPFYLLPSAQQEKDRMLYIFRTKAGIPSRLSLGAGTGAQAAAVVAAAAAAPGGAATTPAAMAAVAAAGQEGKGGIKKGATGTLFEAGDTAYAVAVAWWLQWARYVGLTVAEMEGLPPTLSKCLGVNAYADDNTATSDPAAKATAIPAAVDRAAPDGIGSRGGGGVAAVPAMNGNHHPAPAAAPASTAVMAGQNSNPRQPSRSPPRRGHSVASRPQEMDNSSLQGRTEWELQPGLADREGELFVLWPRDLWEAMVEWYSGGPIFARKVVALPPDEATSCDTLVLGPVAPKLNTADVLVKPAAGSEEPAAAAGPVSGPGSSSPSLVLAVDLYPIGFHINVCDPLGWPSVRERLVLTSRHNTLDKVVDDVFDSFGLPRPDQHFGDEESDASTTAAAETVGNGVANTAVGSEGTRRGSAKAAAANGSPGKSRHAKDTKDTGGPAGGILVSGGGANGNGEAVNGRVGPLVRSKARLWVLEMSRDGLLDSEVPTLERRPSLQPLKPDACGEMDESGSGSTSGMDSSGPAAVATAAGNGPDGSQQGTPASRPRHMPRFSFGGGLLAQDSAASSAAGGGGTGAGPGGIMRWRLMSARQHRMTMSALRLEGGEKLMLEVWRDADGKGGGGWPRAAHVEKPGWRKFSIGDRLDAMDYQGRWYAGSVVGIEKVVVRPGQSATDGPVARRRKSGSQDMREAAAAAATPPLRDPPVVPGRVRIKVRVRFDRFEARWDEFYDAMSVKLAPERSYTAAAPARVAAGAAPAGTAAAAVGGAAAAAAAGDRAIGARSPSIDGEEEGAVATAAGAVGVPSAATAAAAAGRVGAVNGGRPPRHGATQLPPAAPVPLQRATSSGSTAGVAEGPAAAAPAAMVAPATGPNPEGISNYANVVLSRRNNTAGKPPLPGACGLVNLGNTCYLNAGLQCISHTPLLRAYLLSDMYVPEINKGNPLGTQGKLAEDFALLLKQLWSEEFLCVFPSKFKRAFIKHKSQFAGNEQQDSAEFLAELVDLLHEDVNRVIDKPYTSPPEDDVLATMTQRQRASEAWERHLARNRSVFVDLFQGQTKTSCRCLVCNHESLTFDPLMYLNLQIPLLNEKMVAIVLLRRVSVGKGSGPNPPTGAGTGGDSDDYPDPREDAPVRYGLMLPRLGEVADLRALLAQRCRIRGDRLILADVYKHQHHKVLDDTKPLTGLGDDDVLVAYEVLRFTPTEPPQTQAAAAANGVAAGATAEPTAATTPAATVAAAAAAAPPATAAAPVARSGSAASGSSLGVESMGDSDIDDPVPLPTPEQLALAAVASAASSAVKAAPLTLDELSLQTFPQEMSGLRPGQRLDVLDHRGKWYSGTVEEILPPAPAPAIGGGNSGGSSVGSASSRVGSLLGSVSLTRSGHSKEGGYEKQAAAPAAAAAAAVGAGTTTAPAPAAAPVAAAGDGASVVGGGVNAASPDKKESSNTGSASAAASPNAPGGCRVRIHYDQFAAKWDEVFTQDHWDRHCLKPLFTHVRRGRRAFDVSIVHRKSVKNPKGAGNAPTAAASAVAAPAAGAVTPMAAVQGSMSPPGSTRALLGSSSHSRGSASGARGAATAPAAPAATGAPPDKELFGLPLLVHCDGAKSARYLWRSVVLQASRFIRGPPEDADDDSVATANSGSVGGDDSPISAADAAAAAAGHSGMSDEELARRLPFRVRIVNAEDPISDAAGTGSVELRPDPSRAIISVLTSRMAVALDWKDPARDYLDALGSTQDDESVKGLKEKVERAREGVSLQDCLKAFVKEEKLEEEAWVCPKCKQPRPAMMKNELWKVPDVLIVFLKRFQSSARWREKIRLLVVFPHSGLDMSPFVCEASEQNSSAGHGGLVYDLFGVVNHMGGMTGGHYTACCRSTPCSREGVEEVGVWGMEHPWLHFDDEYVEEIAPDKIVSDAAYVLFYRRRRLTPSNVINLTV